MTSDPKAPGADAVYLNIVEEANDPLHYETHYAQIKVFKDKGKDLATVMVPYLKGTYKIADIRGRTIHPDGTVIPLTAKPQDLLVEKVGDKQIGREVFNLPSVEVGSILEYQYSIRYDDDHYSSPSWEVQQPYFVHEAHYRFTAAPQFIKGVMLGAGTTGSMVDERGNPVTNLIWWSKLPHDATVKSDENGRYSLDIDDVPAAPQEEWMPPGRSFLYQVVFYYEAAADADDFWIKQSKQWSKDVDRFAASGKEISDAVAGLISPGDIDEQKARKLYEAVQGLDNTDYSRAKGRSELKQLKLKEAKRAEDIWKQKSGDSEEIAMLYLAMVRAAGLKAYALKVVARDLGVFDITLMDLDQLDDTLVFALLGNRGILLDPGVKMCPFGTVDWRHSNTAGLQQSAEGPGFVTIPAQAYNANSTERVGDVDVDADGKASGLIQFVMTGQEALRWRQEALRNSESELKSEFDRELERLVPDGVVAHVDHFLEVNRPDSNLIATIRVHGQLATRMSKHLLMPAFLFEAKEQPPFVGEATRKEAVDMRYGERVSDQITYHFPDGITLEGGPTEKSIPWSGHAAYATKTVFTPGQVLESRTFARAFTQAKPEEYQDLRSFYQKVAASDQQQLVLTMPAQAAKGN